MFTTRASKMPKPHFLTQRGFSLLLLARVLKSATYKLMLALRIVCAPPCRGQTTTEQTDLLSLGVLSIHDEYEGDCFNLSRHGEESSWETDKIQIQILILLQTT